MPKKFIFADEAGCFTRLFARATQVTCSVLVRSPSTERSFQFDMDFR
jgi:hypothetical protein